MIDSLRPFLLLLAPYRDIALPLVVVLLVAVVMVLANSTALPCRCS